MLSIAAILESNAREYPEKSAIIFQDNKFTFSQINAMANQVANGLKESGIQKGDRVAFTCPNLPYFPIVYFGIIKAGAIVVPLNILLKAIEVEYHLNDSKAKAYFCFEGTAELPMGRQGHTAFEKVPSCEHFWMITAIPADPSPIEGTSTLGGLIHGKSPEFTSVPTLADDTAIILYTSGTTGQAKGAELTQSNVMMNTILTKQLFEGGPDDIHLVVLPLFHTFGQTVQMLGGLLGGNTLVLVPRFDAEVVLQTLEKENITVFCGVPTMYWGLVNHADPENKINLKKIASTLRLCASGGASIPVEIIKQFEEKFNVPILEGYGLSETSPVATFNRIDIEKKPGSVGVPIWGVEVQIFDQDDKPLLAEEVGEIVVRGHNVMKGYLDRPEATQEAMRNGWFHTGDLGKKDQDGYVYIVDRVKDMILRGGFNVYPREIEEVLITHPAISMAAVIGVPHESHGEEVKAFVILKEGDEATEEEIIQWSKEQMASYKYPRFVEMRESLPMNATGKILKRELKSQ